MPTNRTATGLARNLLVGLAILLVVGVAGSLFMGVRAQRAQIASTVAQASAIADNSLGLVFRPDDLTAPSTTERAAELDSRVASSVLNPSVFDSVTLWSQNDQILYSTQGRIGNTLEAESDRIRNALRGEPQTQDVGGVFSVMLPLSLPSGVGLPTVVELTTPSGPLHAAPAPWRTNAIFLLILLVIVGFALYRVLYGPGSTRREAGAVAVERAAAAGRVTSHAGRPVAAPPSPGLREESEARRKAEDRARAAEERLSTLQGQYRNTLEELQSTQRRVQEQASAMRPDPRLQEDLSRAEQRAREQELKARELQTRLRVLEEEQRDLAKASPDPAVIEATNERLAEITRERDLLRRDKDALEARQFGIVRERDALSAKTEELAAAHDRLVAEQAELAAARDELLATQEALSGQRDQAVAQRDALAAEREEYNSDREGFESAHDRLVAERDQMAHRAEELTTAAQQLADKVEELAAQRDELAAARDDLATQRDELAAARDRLVAEKGELAASGDRAVEEHDELVAARDALAAERDTLSAEREQLMAERERLVGDRRQLEAQRDELATQMGDLVAERDEFAQERDDTAEQRDELATQRDDLVRARDELAERQSQTEAQITELVAQRDGLASQMEQLVAQREDLTAVRDRLVAERDGLAERLADAERESAEEPELTERALQAETEAIGLRAELEGAQTQLHLATRELEELRELAEKTRELQEDLDAAHVDTLHHREGFEVMRTELQAAQEELDDARGELRILRTEEARAVMLEDELRAAKAELDSAIASHQADLVEREAELESKVRTAREEFQGQLAAMETQHQDDMAARDRKISNRLAAAEAAAEAKVERIRQELADRDERYGVSEQIVAQAKEESTRLTEELARTKLELDETIQHLLAETNNVREVSDRADYLQREATDANARAERLAEGLDDATQSNADLNRRLQELEARRALEIADEQGRADLDQLLRVTQERLAGQTERLIAAEDNGHRLERELTSAAETIEQLEGEMRQREMAEAMRQLRGEDAEPSEAAQLPAPPPGAGGVPAEDRRATSPFMKELSHDARKSLTQILGLTQILKHKKDAKEQAQLVRQLTNYARRLDHVVSDMAEADNLVHGTVELTVRRTDLEALVHRVVDESGVAGDHEVRIDAERVVVALDALRTEQILAGLLRASADRTHAKKPITVRITNHHGGALLSVEDEEPSSDASLSPVVQRFAEVQGGWAKVESAPNGGSAFRVFLPDGAKASPDDPRATDDAPAPVEPAPEETPGADEADAATPATERTIVVADRERVEVDEQDAWSPEGAELLVQELHRLSEISSAEE
jgi:chromosome segregation ATPase